MPIIGILGVRTGFPIMDSIAAIVIGLFIIKTAVSIGMDALGKMTDRACDDETIDRIREVILVQEHVAGIDRLKTRLFANKIYVDVEIRVYPIIRFYRIFEEIFRLCKKVKSDVCPEAHKDEPTKQGEKLTEKAMKWNYGIDPSVDSSYTLDIAHEIAHHVHDAIEGAFKKVKRYFVHINPSYQHYQCTTSK